MSIDWFTVVAQIVNFLVLVWLLQRFLYKPVLDAVKKREQKIAGQLADAAAALSSADGKKKEYEEKRLALEQGSSALMETAKAEAGTEKDRLLAEARKVVETQRAGWLEALRQEREHAGREMVDKTRSAVLDIARHCLQDLADTGLQERMTAAFMRMIDGLVDNQRQVLAAALRASPVVTVKSAFALREEDRTVLAEKIAALRGAGGEGIGFEVDPALLCGIGLYMSGYKLEWAIGDYLEKIGASAAELSWQEMSATAISSGTSIKTV
ncbi:MAG TPA: hypothetical protein VKQ52_10395 [Puia sp.]|nr:hypothetical protein [Puia sp.]